MIEKTNGKQSKKYKQKQNENLQKKGKKNSTQDYDIYAVDQGRGGSEPLGTVAPSNRHSSLTIQNA